MMAAKNYYSILDVSRSATKEEIKKAYRNLSLKFHPDKSDMAGAEERFKDIAEAYRVLSAEEERQKYDRFEEEIHFFTRETKSRDSGGPDIFFDGPGLKKPKTSCENENGDAGATFIKDFFDDEDFLTEMMNDITFLNGSTRSGPRRTTRPVPIFEQQFFRDTTNFEFSTPNKKFKPEVQDPPVEKELLVSLEELNTGVTKKFNISRKVYNQNGSFFFEDKLLIITVMPGWKEGTKITFSKEGDRNPGVIPADIVFKLKDKTHKDFGRDNENNLIYNCKISLCEALVGASVDIPTIDGKFLRITHDEIIQPGTQKLIKGEGLPRPNNPSTRADLIVKYEIFFPSYLSPHQREIISNFLPS